MRWPRRSPGRCPPLHAAGAGAGRPARRGRARPRRNRRPALLRLRHRRRVARGDRGRHARRRAGTRSRFNAVTSPAAVAAEDVAGGWLKDLLGLPPTASVGFVTGGQAANTVGLAAARHHVLADAGWDVERRRADRRAADPGRSPSDERHATIDRSLRLLGLGRGRGRAGARRRQRRHRPRVAARGAARRYRRARPSSACRPAT